MPRAKRICLTDGCLKAAVKDGKCSKHKRPAWEGSQRNLNRPSNWSTTRQSALKRDGHQCVQCGKAATDVDHIRPVSLGGSWSLDNLQSLCGSCHMVKTMREAADRQARMRP